MAFRYRYALPLLASAGLLTACLGGGDDDPLPPGTPTGASVPDSALATSASWTAYAKSLSATASETDEPLNASNVSVPPSSETDEPAPAT